MADVIRIELETDAEIGATLLAELADACDERDATIVRRGQAGPGVVITGSVIGEEPASALASAMWFMEFAVKTPELQSARIMQAAVMTQKEYEAFRSTTPLPGAPN